MLADLLARKQTGQTDQIPCLTLSRLLVEAVAAGAIKVAAVEAGAAEVAVEARTVLRELPRKEAAAALLDMVITAAPQILAVRAMLLQAAERVAWAKMRLVLLLR